MLVKLKIPKTILWVINLFGIFLLIFTLFRLTTLIAFKPGNIRLWDTGESFLLGWQYDMRWIAIILLPVILISLNPRFSPFYSEKNKKWWAWYLVIITFLLFFFFAADFGSFTYNRTRLDAGALNFAEDAEISMEMIWQSYPIIWLLLALFAGVFFFRWMYHRSHWTVITRTDGLGIPYRRKWFVVSAVLLLIFINGFSLQPLTWEKAFTLKDSFKSYLALNPMQNFFTTLRFRRPLYNEEKARSCFPLMADLLQLKDKHNFTYQRVITPGSSTLESRPNVVLVLCESFSMYKSSMSGNPLNATPFFDSMCNRGIFFERCFTPHFSTARGLFATVTGIPDVQLYKFSTRNPAALHQHTIINSFEEYEKMYFLGGDPEFNNFRGLIENIDGIEMYTEGKFSSPKINVWGISDKDLFLEANKVFRQKKTPFFAIVQTADNHRPFMIPGREKDFQKKTVAKDSLLRYGFESVEEYNSFRYADFCFQTFIEAAQKEPYFHNTLFVFVGDHGVSGNARALYPPAWTDQRLTDEHVPLLFYAPYLLQPQRRAETVSQIDVLPTIAGMISQPYLNTTLGRDLLDTAKKNDLAFIINGQGKIGLVNNEYYFTMNIDFPSADSRNSSVVEFPDPQLYPVKNEAILPSPADTEEIKKKMMELTNAYYETAKWMLLNNKTH